MIATTRNSLESVAKEFELHPLDFTVEADIQARIFEDLRERLRESGELKTGFTNEDFYERYVAQYKSTFADHFQEKASESEPLTRIHVELSPLADDEYKPTGSRNQLDVAVLGNTLSNPLHWKDGTKRFDPSDIEIAIELKYVKNKNRISTTLNDTELDDASSEDVKESLLWDQNNIRVDLDRLDTLADPTATFLAIFSNYDYMYRGSIQDSVDRKEKRYSILGDAAANWLSEYPEETSVLYVHPTGYEWFMG